MAQMQGPITISTQVSCDGRAEDNGLAGVNHALAWAPEELLYFASSMTSIALISA